MLEALTAVPDVVVRLNKCRTCKTYKEYSEYYFNGTRAFLDCKVCYIAAKEAQRQEFITWIHALKVERGCTDCGYNANALALQFDHLPGHVKKFGIADGASRSRKSVLAEIAKTEVVCANCHAVRTNQRYWERKNGPRPGS